ncbi:DUF1284 domain-containing protein [Clostridium sp. LP20]|uniref:DUF1284 domain-containing protein n=1 Tax=Clostridium sp. LP20 TaxID=3418665 RepID=UPI003EE56413
MLELRPHHINCLFFYRGMGYSEDFVMAMSSIENLLIENTDTEIGFILNCDILCTNCPNRLKGNSCITEERIKILDLRAINEYGLDLNRKYKFTELKNSIYTTFDKEKFKNICSDCEWFKKGICSIEFIKEQELKWI